MKVNLQSPPEGTVRDWIDHRAAETGEETAFLFFDGGGALTWSELRRTARRVAAQLTGKGVAKGESVAIVQPNGREAIESIFGVLYGGFRATVINLAAGDDAIAYALDHCEGRSALVEAEQIEMFNRCCPPAMSILPITDTCPDISLHPLRPEDDALLMYTSGTTGRPKGVVHTHSSLLAGGWTPTIAHHLTPADCGLCVLPICHINGLCVTVMGTLVSGGKLAVAEKFSASRFWSQCAEVKATWFSVVPTIISHLLHSEMKPDPATRSRLRFGRSASSPLAPDVQTTFETRFDVPIVETMGLTETAAQILSNPLPPGVRRIGSPGVAIGCEACILSAELTPLSTGQKGELAVRGANVMKEYFRNPEATASTFTPDGWLRTGDLGFRDEEGYYFVTGRLKELIIKGGENIAPREIDEALYSHPDVIEAAAFSRPCDTYGERVEAAVKLRNRSALTSEKLISICHDKLGKFKSPDRVYILDDLPKGPSGKIQRIKIAQLIDEPVR